MSSPHPTPLVGTAVDGDVWHVTLDSPDTGNAVDLELTRQLADALAARPDGARAVLLTATGPRFSVGGNIGGFVAAEDAGAHVAALAEAWHGVIRAVVGCPVPVVAGVHGAVAGAAVGLMGACDVVVCARSTKIRPAYAGIGYTPDGGTSWALTRALGAPRALELLLTDGMLTSADAHLFGLVGRLADDDALLSTARELAHRVAAGPVTAMVRTRSLVRLAALRTLEEQLDEEARLITLSAASAEGREGVLAFSERRTPDFRAAAARDRTT